MVRIFRRVQRIQDHEMREREEYQNEEYSLSFESYQKVKETSFEVFGCSGGVARFSIMAFRAIDRGFESRPEGGKESLASREAPL
jgi:hypothetical protein